MIKNFIFSILLLLVIEGSWADENEESVTFYEKIFEEHCQRFLYLEKSNPTLLVMFSGTPGMGKTTVAKKLEERFQGLRINADDVRIILRKYHLRDEKLVNSYLVWCMDKLLKISPNHLIILDRSVDRKYDTCVGLAKKYNCETFLIRMQVERGVVEERIRLRGVDVENLLRDAPIYWSSYELFGKTYAADYYYDNNDGVESAFGEVVEILNLRILNFANRGGGGVVFGYVEEK